MVAASYFGKSTGWRQTKTMVHSCVGNIARTPQRTAFFKEEARQKPLIRELVNESLAEARMKMGSVPAMDARFDHPKGATSAVITAIDIASIKIVAFAPVLRVTYVDPGNFDGPAGAMEGLKRVLIDLMSWLKSDQISMFIHDEGASTALLHKLGLNQVFDPNHVAKSAAKVIKKISDGHKVPYLSPIDPAVFLTRRG
jgi:hypothetical protein